MKHMKRCAIPLIIREMQINTTMKYHLTLVTMAIIKKSTKKKKKKEFWRGCGEKGTLLYCWWECKLVQPFWRTVRRLAIELKTTMLKAQVGSVVPNALWPHGLSPTRLLFPWKFLGKKTVVGCHFLLQGIFPIQGLNSCVPRLLHCRWILYCWATKEAPELLYDPAISLLGLYSEKTIIQYWIHASQCSSQHYS